MINMFKNSFEELLFLRFLSKNAEHKRKMNQKMLETQRELVRIQNEKSTKGHSDNKLKTNITPTKTRKKFDLTEEIKDFKPFDKNISSESKRKNVFLSILLTLTLGPVGLIYSTIKFAAIMTIIFVIAVIIRIDYNFVWFIINTTIVFIGIYKTLKWNENLDEMGVNKF